MSLNHRRPEAIRRPYTVPASEVVFMNVFTFHVLYVHVHCLLPSFYSENVNDMDKTRFYNNVSG